MILLGDEHRSFYAVRGRRLRQPSLSDPTTVETRQTETVDDDHSFLLLAEAYMGSRE